MENTIINKSGAIAELNKIEGFDPTLYTRTLTNDSGETTLYLDVKYRVLWFRLAYPNGKISKKLMKLDEKQVVVEAKVYADKNDPEDCFLASGFAHRFYNESSTYGVRFVEIAETAAIGRALSSAGFGIQFCELGGDFDATPVDSGIAVKPSEAQESSEVEHKKDETSKEKTEVAPQPKAEKPQPKAESAPVVEKPTYNQKTPVEDICKIMTIEEAKNVNIMVGFHKGKTLGQLAIEKPTGLDWYVKSYSGQDNILRAAAKVLIDKACSVAC